MNYDCDMIQDLIPLVKEGVAGTASKSAVTQHIEECAVCKGIYEIEVRMISSPLTDRDGTAFTKVTDYKTRIKRRRKLTISLAVLFAVVLVIGTAAATTKIVSDFFQGDSYTTRDVADYGNYAGHMEAEAEGFFSLLKIFPHEILPSAEVKDYYYYANNGHLDNSYQLYLLCSYEEGDFILEKKRLESIEITFKNVTQRPVLTDSGFEYPAVVTIFDDQNSFEYALIEEGTNTIAYVFAQSMGIDKEVVPPQYRPKGFKPPKDALAEWGGYNVYRFQLDDGILGTYVIPRKENPGE